MTLTVRTADPGSRQEGKAAGPAWATHVSLEVLLSLLPAAASDSRGNDASSPFTQGEGVWPQLYFLWLKKQVLNTVSLVPTIRKYPLQSIRGTITKALEIRQL